MKSNFFFQLDHLYCKRFKRLKRLSQRKKKVNQIILSFESKNSYFFASEDFGILF